MSEANVSMLQQALKNIKASKPSESDAPTEEADKLEQAMADLQNAKSDKERAIAFRAALELAK